MRTQFASALAEIGKKDERVVMLTADLGFSALEPVRDVLGERFIDAGITEQHMMSVAAGMAREGMRPFVYSIAPFITMKTVEQLRNDVGHHGLPVTVVGVGGGYAYGVHGASHHVLEDVGVMSVLGSVHSYVPAFEEEIAGTLTKIMASAEPAYLRLSRGNIPPGMSVPVYSPVRQLTSGEDVVVIALGPMTSNVLEAAHAVGDVAAVWVVTELPVELPMTLWRAIHAAQRLLIVEEHQKTGGLGSAVWEQMMLSGVRAEKIAHLAANGYVSGLTGSQQWHWAEHGLDVAGITEALTWLTH